MATLSAIRSGLKTRLDLLDLSPYSGVNVSAYGLSAPVPPCVMVVGPEGVEYDAAMGRGHDNYTITVQALVGLATDRGAQEVIDKMLDSSGVASVKARIEGDRTLGGAVQDARVVESTGYRQYVTAVGEVLGCEWTVFVMA